MEKDERVVKKNVLPEKIENLIAIGAAAAANCIPCFEHLYEKAVTSGITVDEINRASEIAGRVKRGANTAMSNSIDELVGSKEVNGLICGKTAAGPCCC
jgi:alkylhydroperoxidase/carboxymuconolactone decarboxylase family protein YurZ